MTENKDDLFGNLLKPDSNSQTSNFGGETFGSNVGQTGFGSGQPVQFQPQEPKKKRNWKPLWFTLIGLSLLGGGIYGYSRYSAYKTEQAQTQKALSNFQVKVNKDVHLLELSKVEDVDKSGISAWDLAASYTSAFEDRLNFVNSVAQLTDVKLKDDGSATLTTVNWEYISWIIKNVDKDKVKAVNSKLDANSPMYEEDLTSALMGYLSENLDDMVHYDGDYVQTYIQDDGVPKPFTKTTLANAYKPSGSSYKTSTKLGIELDKLNFSSDEFHTTLDTLSAVVKDTFGEATESDDHAKWRAEFEKLDTYLSSIQIYEGVSFKGEDLSLDEADRKTGAKKVPTTVETAYAARQALKKDEPAPYKWAKSDAKLETWLGYDWVGSYYIANDKEAKANNIGVRKGTGTYEDPLTFGTPFVTKMLGTDGNYHDVKVTVTGISVGDDAIKKAMKYDERNSGFTNTSNLVLAIVTFKVENLENAPITVDSEFTLADADKNLVSRTGSMFSMPEEATIEVGAEADMADWVYTEETKTLNLMWGETFNRQFDSLFINVLGDEVYDKYGRTIDRNTKKVVENKLQDNEDYLKQYVEEKSKTTE